MSVFYIVNCFSFYYPKKKWIIGFVLKEENFFPADKLLSPTHFTFEVLKYLKL
jgi:hypothetical protein